MWATVQGNAVFVENAEDGASAAESALAPYVIDGVTAIVHVDNGCLSWRDFVDFVLTFT